MGQPVKLFRDSFVFEHSLRNDVFLPAGDLDGDGIADLIVGGSPRVFALGGRQPTAATASQVPVANHFAGDGSVFAWTTDVRGRVRT
jgi:hypothetical protein